MGTGLLQSAGSALELRIDMMVARHCECTKCPETPLKLVNFRLCECRFNKLFLFINQNFKK